MATACEIRLSFVEEKILNHFSILVEKEIREARKIILFGSRARGESDENSDMDVAVVLDVKKINKEQWEQLWDLKWRVLESLDAEEFPLSLIIMTMSDFISNEDLEGEIKKKGLLYGKGISRGRNRELNKC